MKNWENLENRAVGRDFLLSHCTALLGTVVYTCMHARMHTHASHRTHHTHGMHTPTHTRHNTPTTHRDHATHTNTHHNTRRPTMRTHATRTDTTRRTREPYVIHTHHTQHTIPHTHSTQTCISTHTYDRPSASPCSQTVEGGGQVFGAEFVIFPPRGKAAAERAA